MKPTISFIVPTRGRQTLQRLISLLREEIGEEDEVIVIGDGPQPTARGILSIPDWRFQYFEVAGGLWGNRQRDAGIKRASRDFLMFADDDDNYVASCDVFKAMIRPKLAENVDRPHMFRCWKGPTGDPVEMCNVMGPMFVPPNKPGKLGRWEQDGANQNLCDFYFIRDTLAFYPEGPIYHDDEIYLVRPN